MKTIEQGGLQVSWNFFKHSLEAESIWLFWRVSSPFHPPFTILKRALRFRNLMTWKWSRLNLLHAVQFLASVAPLFCCDCCSTKSHRPLHLVGQRTHCSPDPVQFVGRNEHSRHFGILFSNLEHPQEKAENSLLQNTSFWIYSVSFPLNIMSWKRLHGRLHPMM